MKFNSTVLILPGLGSSEETHWQSLWEKQFPEFIRVQQHDWDTPRCEDWIDRIDKEISKHDPENTILVGHSLACATIVFWSIKYNRKIKGALLVAPSDTDAPSYPSGTIGFIPMPLNRLPFPSITVSSSNDGYVTLEQAKFFAYHWGSEFVTIGEAGHINVESGFGEWNEGLRLLEKLDQNKA